MNELLLTYLSRYFLTYARASVLRDSQIYPLSTPIHVLLAARHNFSHINCFQYRALIWCIVSFFGNCSRGIVQVTFMDGRRMIRRFRRLSMGNFRHFSTHKLHGRLDLLSHLFIFRMHVHQIIKESLYGNKESRDENEWIWRFPCNQLNQSCDCRKEPCEIKGTTIPTCQIKSKKCRKRPK